MTDVLIVAEHRRGDLRDISFEAISAGRELAAKTGGDLDVTVIGGQTEKFANELDREGVDRVLTVADGKDFNHGVYLQVLKTIVAKYDPGIVLVPNSVNGLDYAPAVAESLDVPLVTDAVDLEYDGGLSVTRQMYGSKVETVVNTEGNRSIVTIRNGEWPIAEAAEGAEIQSVEVDIDEDALGTTVTGYQEATGGDVDISDAEFIVSVGRGIEEEENIPLIEALVEVTGATLASSRPIVDNGWLAESRQVGQSGKSVTPDVYIAIGISGAVQHIAGMKGSETIIAINTDPNAPIFDIADYGIVGDLFDVVPPLIEEFGGDPDVI